MGVGIFNLQAFASGNRLWKDVWREARPGFSKIMRSVTFLFCVLAIEGPS